MVWPPNDNAITKQTSSKLRKFAVKQPSDENADMQLSSSGVKYTVLKRQWNPTIPSLYPRRSYDDEYEETPIQRREAIRPINYNEDSDQEMSFLESAHNQRSEPPQNTVSKTESLRHMSHTSPTTGLPHQKKARTHNHRQHAIVSESSRVRPRSSDLENLSTTDLRMTSKAPTRQSTRYSAPTEKDDSDGGLEILSFAPPSFDRSPRIKEEGHTVKSERISTEVSLYYLEESVKSIPQCLNSLRRPRCKSGSSDCPV